MRRTAGVLLLLGAVVCAATRSHAHPGGGTGYATIAVQGESIRYTLTLWPASLPPPLAEQLQQARAGDAASRARFVGYIADKITLTAKGTRCEAGPGSLLPPSAADSVSFVVEFTCAAPVRELLIRDDLFDVLGADYHTLARIEAPGHRGQFAFSPEARESRVRLDGGGRGRDALSFVLLGIEHILTGWDHLLFLLALLLPGGSLIALAKIVTAFTLAHSVTLALAALDIVVLPDRLIEPVIALSIAAVAAENLFLRPTVTRRWMVSFGFGLVHGFGFSSVLREIGLPGDGLVIALFGFNAGVELGQALVVAVALPALLFLRRAGWERRMIRGSSMAILLVGLVLFVERAFG